MDKPEALRLAEMLEQDPRSKAHHDEAAAELRLLYADNFSLIVVNKALAERQEWWNERMFALKTQRNQLLEALKTYGWHTEDCPQYPTHARPKNWPACTCGFDAAIKVVEEGK